MNVARIIGNTRIDGFWFLQPREYEVTNIYYLPVKVLFNKCEDACQGQTIVVYDVLVDGLTKTIPASIASLLQKEAPSPDQQVYIQRIEAERTFDMAAFLTDGKTDVVYQAERFFGLDLSQHYAQVDEERLRQLRREQERYSHDTG